MGDFKNYKKNYKIYMLELWNLFFTFAKIGSVTFGGGYAMLPILQRDIVNARHWATDEELMDYFAVGQCTPGIIAVNTATFIGQKRAGIAGGIAATLGMVFPSLVIISLIAALIANFAYIPWVKNAFAGIQVCVCVLIFNAVMKLLKKAVTDRRTVFIFALVLAGGVVLNLSPVWFVIVSAFAGIGLKTLEASDLLKRGKEKASGVFKRANQKTSGVFKRGNQKTSGRFKGGNQKMSGKNKRNRETGDGT